MKAHRGNRYSAALSLTSALEGVEWSTPSHGRSSPGKDTRYPLSRRLVGPQGRSGRVRKISPSRGFELLIVQPVANALLYCAELSNIDFACRSKAISDHEAPLHAEVCVWRGMSASMLIGSIFFEIINSHYFLNATGISVGRFLESFICDDVISRGLYPHRSPDLNPHDC
jgi:hypothetical protein